MTLKKKPGLLFLVIIFFTLLFFSVSKSFSEQNELITSCEINDDNIHCINLNSIEDFMINLYDDPFRIQIIFKKELVIENKRTYNPSFVKGIRFNKNLKSSSKLVLEFNKPTIISNINYYKNNNHHINVSMYFSHSSKANYAIAKYVLNKTNGNIFSLDNDVNILPKKIYNSPEGNKFSKKVKSKKNYIVFIDPGHGGRDPGAIGHLGTLEKNITLRASILLAKALQKKQKITPILSRYKDIFVSLKKRTMIAKKNKADIFISIHADSSKNKKANGISVFSLSDKASDNEALMLAQRENEVDNFLGNNEKIVDPLIYGTLIKMFQREAMNDSSFLAKSILSNLEKTKLAVNRGHRFAGFSVLKSYDIPSVLIEIGFLSNRNEEKKLLNSKYLDELSKGLAIAIENYFTNYER